jgi:hypothetical protein
MYLLFIDLLFFNKFEMFTLIGIGIRTKISSKSLFDTQCLQLLEYMRLTTNYYKLVVICIRPTMIRNRI